MSYLRMKAKGQQKAVVTSVEAVQNTGNTAYNVPRRSIYALGERLDTISQYNVGAIVARYKYRGVI